MRGTLTTAARVAAFIEAGSALFTIRSIASGTRFTFRAKRPKEEEHRARQAQYAHGHPRPRPIWVSVLNGPENTSDYAFLGTVWPEGGKYRYAHSPKSHIGLDAPSVKALQWLIGHMPDRMDAVFERAELWHEGRCGRCGRTLTVPESIESGFGPECIHFVNTH